uniref:Transposase n=1 Tax=Romanomermis culicivorax TaxID=13658 RepID=A0A915KVG3_ROMCU
MYYSHEKSGILTDAHQGQEDALFDRNFPFTRIRIEAIMDRVLTIIKTSVVYFPKIAAFRFQWCQMKSAYNFLNRFLFTERWLS